MPDATYTHTDFRGGIWGQWAQGRFHDPRYATALNDCLNSLPVESGACIRRPGTKLALITRNGNPGRTVKWDYKQAQPYTLEFTDGHLRFRQGTTLVTTNDSVTVAAISGANPAVMQLSAAVTWLTGDQIYLTIGNNPLLENRIIALTKIDTTHFSLTDAITSANINGAALAPITGTITANRILDLASPYVGGSWASLRSVQAEAISFLLQGGTPPQALIASTTPTPTAFGTFSLAAATFDDGPYLDPFTNGVQANPNKQTGIVTLTLSFPAFVATTSYALGDFVTSSSINYQSLVDQNVGNTPVSSPSQWAAVSAGAAINDGQGFLGTDVGRLVRLFSEPALWAAGTTYATGNVVSYNPSGLPGGQTYWQSLVSSNTGNAPGADLTHWQIMPIGIFSVGTVQSGGPQGGSNITPAEQSGATTPALWTWGKIVSLANQISQTLSGSVNVGTMTGNGGLAAAFNTITSQNASASAAFNGGSSLSVDAYVGKNYSGASAQAIEHGTCYPSSDLGFGAGARSQISSVTINLRAKASAPSSASDGTLLGTTGAIANTVSPVTIISSDQVTTWNYVWFEIIGSFVRNDTNTVYCAQAQFFNPPGTGTGNAINVELLGQPLLYSTTISTWRLGAYSNTTGWPTCGTYSDGRLWLSGAIANRIDGAVSNGISGGSVNFAPTDQYGNVLASSGVTAVFNAPDVNPIFWMEPDLQGIVCGTQKREFLVYGPSSGGITPFNIAVRMTTEIGSANIEPRRTEHTLVFIQAFLRKAVEAFADVFSGKFTAPNLFENAKQLTIGGIQELAYQRELAPTLWMRVANGLIGMLYKRDTLMTSQGPTINGAHRHALGSGRIIESIAVGPSVSGTTDSLSMVTNDTTANLRFVEVLGDLPDEGATFAQAAYLDASVIPTSSSIIAPNGGSLPYGGLQLNGLWYLNGKTVSAWLGGLDCGDYIVSNGSIIVPFGDGIAGGLGAFPNQNANRGDQGLFTQNFVSTGITANGTVMFTGTMPALVGFTFTSQGQLVRPYQPAETGARNGPAFAKLARDHYIMAQFENTQGVSLGVALNDATQPLRQALFKGKDGQTDLTVDQPFTGIFRDQFEHDYGFDAMPCWQVTRPYPCNVMALGAAQQTADV